MILYPVRLDLSNGSAVKYRRMRASMKQSNSGNAKGGKSGRKKRAKKRAEKAGEKASEKPDKKRAENDRKTKEQRKRQDTRGRRVLSFRSEGEPSAPSDGGVSALWALWVGAVR